MVRAFCVSDGIFGDALCACPQAAQALAGTLTASWIEALTERQIVGNHVARAGEIADVGDLVKMRVKLGAERVFRMTPVESDFPTRSSARQQWRTAMAQLGPLTYRVLRGF
jgi:hypothetical protein